jgi:nitric oxide reductase NorD protein
MTSSAPCSKPGEAPTGAEADRHTVAELEARLEEFLFAAPSHRSATRIAEGLATLSRDRQDFALRWAEIAAQSYTELGYQVAMLVPQALDRMDREAAEAWVLAALELFDKHGGRAAMDFLRDIDGFLLRRERGEAVALFEAVEARVGRFVTGLSGRPLRVSASTDGSSWTDTETVFLPPSIADRPAHAANLAQFRLRAAMLWGQARYGTFNADPGPVLGAWPDRDRALAWLAVLEAVRVEACITRALPGLGREIAAARPAWPADLVAVVSVLGTGEASIEDSLRVLEALRRAGAADRPPPASPFAGRLDPDAARRVRAERIEREKDIVRRAIAAIRAAGSARAQESPLPAVEAEADAAGDHYEIRIDGEAAAMPPEARAALRSLVQDLGEIPPEALVPAGPAPWAPTGRPGADLAPVGAERADFVHDEWDYRRNAFRAGWCHLYEHRVAEGDRDYVPAVRHRHRALIAQLRRRFEALRGEDRILRRQPDGEEVDLDALVAARADRRAGTTVSPNLFSRRVRNERSLAVMFMVDMSGSTQGWVNDAEREALVMLAEAVETLGDAWAVYGFSGWTRTRCDLYRVKDFTEAFDENAERRIAAIAARDYTRMGVAIRHLSGLLAAQPAKHRLLVTLSDGKPDDFADEYRSRYGIEDTRHALLEARAKGIRSYCVTIDRNGADYLRHMYGPARYTVLDDVRKLSLRIADIYRRLAT